MRFSSCQAENAGECVGPIILNSPHQSRIFNVFALIYTYSQNYPGEEILVVYDYDFRYGENFYVCVTEEAKELVLNVSW